MMKKLCSLLLALCLLLIPFGVLAAPVDDAAVSKLDHTRFVHDLADQLTDGQEKDIQEIAQGFHEETGWNMVLVTAPDLSDGEEARQLAENIYQNAGGKGYSADGVILVLNTEKSIFGAASFGEAAADNADRMLEQAAGLAVKLENSDHPADSFNLGRVLLLCAQELFRHRDNEELPLPMVYDYASIDPKVKIHDHGELMTEDEKQELEQLAQAFVKRYQMDIAVVTVQSAETEEDAMCLADDIYDYAGGTGFGKDGLLLLIDMVNRKYWISTKGTAITTFWDDDIEWMKGIVVHALQNETPAETADAFIRASEQVCSARYAMEAGSKEAYVKHFDGYDGHWAPAPGIGEMLLDKLGTILLIAVIVGVVTGLVYYYVGRKKHRPVKVATEASDYVSQPLELSVCRDDLIDRHVTRRARPKDTGSGGSSGGGGGGSSHSSSSGSSHGGGGGSF